MNHHPCKCCGIPHDEIGLTMAQAAAFRGLSERTIARRIASGELRTTLVGRNRRVRPEDLRVAFRTR